MITALLPLMLLFVIVVTNAGRRVVREHREAHLRRQDIQEFVQQKGIYRGRHG